jgi:hypothetical protein
MDEIELTPEQIDGLNKLALFLRDAQMPKSPLNSRRRPRCSSCDDGKYYNGKQLEDSDDEGYINK